ncbi:hypothetical protein GW17_00018798 [Ensete ventricosum]|nr:hypothetical protein GW17_00018798 [Ensete ventricosum]RZR77530.1 hypothetical protein BHM03_00002642 [Ensete ventricosum]
MASATTDGDDVVLELIDPSAVQNELRPETVTSNPTSGVETWNIGLLLQSPSVKVRANRNRRVVFTDQFLLCMYVGCCFKDLFGSLLSVWLSNPPTFAASFVEASGYLLCRNVVACFWDVIAGVGFVPELCKGYLARNFVVVIYCSCFQSLKLLSWNSLLFLLDNFLFLDQVRISLLPLEFAAGSSKVCPVPVGLRRDFSQLGEEAICTILDLMKDSFSIILPALVDDKLDNFRIRLTEYSEVLFLFFIY